MENSKNGRYTFKRLEMAEQCGRLDEYDLFQVLSDHFADMNMVYMSGEFYLITAGQKMKLIDRDLLRNRNFIYKNNYAKQFIQEYGKEVFNLLTLPELISVLSGNPIKEEELEER